MAFLQSKFGRLGAEPVKFEFEVSIVRLSLPSLSRSSASVVLSRGDHRDQTPYVTSEKGYFYFSSPLGLSLTLYRKKDSKQHAVYLPKECQLLIMEKGKTKESGIVTFDFSPYAEKADEDDDSDSLAEDWRIEKCVDKSSCFITVRVKAKRLTAERGASTSKTAASNKAEERKLNEHEDEEADANGHTPTPLHDNDDQAVDVRGRTRGRPPVPRAATSTIPSSTTPTSQSAGLSRVKDAKLSTKPRIPPSDDDDQEDDAYVKRKAGAADNEDEDTDDVVIDDEDDDDNDRISAALKRRVPVSSKSSVVERGGKKNTGRGKQRAEERDDRDSDEEEQDNRKSGKGRSAASVSSSLKSLDNVKPVAKPKPKKDPSQMTAKELLFADLDEEDDNNNMKKRRQAKDKEKEKDEDEDDDDNQRGNTRKAGQTKATTAAKTSSKEGFGRTATVEPDKKLSSSSATSSSATASANANGTSKFFSLSSSPVRAITSQQLFSCSLSESVTVYPSSLKSPPPVPYILTFLLQNIEKAGGLTTPRLFKADVNRDAQRDAVRTQIESGQWKLKRASTQEDAHVLAAVLKLWISNLTDGGIIPPALHSTVLSIGAMQPPDAGEKYVDEDDDTDIAGAMKKLISKLAPLQRRSLYSLCEFFANMNISANVKKNEMKLTALSAIFGPLLIRLKTDSNKSTYDQWMEKNNANKFVEYLIQHKQLLQTETPQQTDNNTHDNHTHTEQQEEEQHETSKTGESDVEPTSPLVADESEGEGDEPRGLRVHGDDSDADDRATVKGKQDKGKDKDKEKEREREKEKQLELEREKERAEKQRVEKEKADKERMEKEKALAVAAAAEKDRKEREAKEKERKLQQQQQEEKERREKEKKEKEEKERREAEKKLSASSQSTSSKGGRKPFLQPNVFDDDEILDEQQEEEEDHEQEKQQDDEQEEESAIQQKNADQPPASAISVSTSSSTSSITSAKLVATEAVNARLLSELETLKKQLAEKEKSGRSAASASSSSQSSSGADKEELNELKSKLVSALKEKDQLLKEKKEADKKLSDSVKEVDEKKKMVDKLQKLLLTKGKVDSKALADLSSSSQSKNGRAESELQEQLSMLQLQFNQMKDELTEQLESERNIRRVIKSQLERIQEENEQLRQRTIHFDQLVHIPASALSSSSSPSGESISPNSSSSSINKKSNAKDHLLSIIDAQYKRISFLEQSMRQNEDMMKEAKQAWNETSKLMEQERSDLVAELDRIKTGYQESLQSKGFDYAQMDDLKQKMSKLQYSHSLLMSKCSENEELVRSKQRELDAALQQILQLEDDNKVLKEELTKTGLALKTIADDNFELKEYMRLHTKGKKA